MTKIIQLTRDNIIKDMFYIKKTDLLHLGTKLFILAAINLPNCFHIDNITQTLPQSVTSLENAQVWRTKAHVHKDFYLKTARITRKCS